MSYFHFNKYRELAACLYMEEFQLGIALVFLVTINLDDSLTPALSLTQRSQSKNAKAANC
jgi:hypothetical protein